MRGLSAFDKNYLDGKFGAIPYFENDEKLKILSMSKRNKFNERNSVANNRDSKSLELRNGKKNL